MMWRARLFYFFGVRWASCPEVIESINITVLNGKRQSSSHVHTFIYYSFIASFCDILLFELITDLSIELPTLGNPNALHVIRSLVNGVSHGSKGLLHKVLGSSIFSSIYISISIPISIFIPTLNIWIAIWFFEN